jgi:hypothetical protein
MSAMPLFAVIRERGPAFDRSRPLEEQELWSEHAEYMDALVNDGFIVLGGPTEGACCSPSRPRTARRPRGIVP